MDKLSAMISVIKTADVDAFKHPVFRSALIAEIYEARRLITKRHYKQGLYALEREVLPRLDNCNQEEDITTETG